jgi:hypothetical protein
MAEASRARPRSRIAGAAQRSRFQRLAPTSDFPSWPGARALHQEAEDTTAVRTPSHHRLLEQLFREESRYGLLGSEADPYAAAALAEAYAYSGAPDRARQTAEEAVTGARQRCLGIVPFAQLQLARVLLRTRGLASRSAIEAALEEASRLARQTEMKMVEPFVCVERAELPSVPTSHRSGSTTTTRKRPRALERQ